MHPCGFAAAVTLIATAPAPTADWQGGAETNPEDWHAAGNWSTGSVPGADDAVNVVAPSECNVSGGRAASVGSLKIGCGEHGSLSIQGAGSSLAASGICLGGYGGYGKGALMQSNGTVTVTGRMSIGHGAGVDGHGTYHATGGTLTVSDTLSVGAGYIAASNSGNGELHVDGAAVSVESVYSGSGTIEGLGRGHGAIRVTAGSLRVAGDFFNSHHMWAAALPPGERHRGHLVVSGGNVSIGGDLHNGYGSGLDTSQVEGVLEVIGAGGTVSIEKDLIQVGGSILVAELAGKDHAVIQVNGNAALAGCFKVRLAEGYTPASGTWWDIVQTGPDRPGALTGTFSKLDFSAVGGPENWKVRYDTDDGAFRVRYVGK
ncbi:MAG TPA: hypothetical protein QGH10_00275 [Armatimonadota bacterium]|nr:hypothetical protein [Armatimonadota bacterium]